MRLLFQVIFCKFPIQLRNFRLDFRGNCHNLHQKISSIAIYIKVIVYGFIVGFKLDETFVVDGSLFLLIRFNSIKKIVQNIFVKFVKVNFFFNCFNTYFIEYFNCLMYCKVFIIEVNHL